MYFIQAWKFDRWMVPGVILVAAVVGSAGIVLPGPQWAYLAAAGAILLLGVLFVRGMAQATLEFLGYLSPAVGWVLARRQRRVEFAVLVRELQTTLNSYGLPGLSEAELVELAEEPSSSAQEDLTHACRAFARGLDGEETLRARVYELLYRDRYDLGTTGCWTDTGEAARQELVEVLLASGRLSEVAPQDFLERVLPWLFLRLREFRLATVQEEVAQVEALWRQVESYAEHLRAEGFDGSFFGRHRSDSLGQILEELDQFLDGGLIGQGAGGRVAEHVLVSAADGWIGAWSAHHDSGDGLAAADLARVHLGIFAAEKAPASFPALPGLALEVAQRPQALGILFGYLWKRSQLRKPALEGSALAVLAERWQDWVKGAEDEMGSGLSHGVRGVLRSRLNNRVWPTWLPILPAIDRMVRQSERIHQDLQALNRHDSTDLEWGEGLDRLSSRIEEMTAVVPAQEARAVVDELWERLSTLREEARERRDLTGVEDALEQLRASLLPRHLRSSAGWYELREAWNRIAQERRPGDLFAVLEECRRGASEIVSRLGELEERLELEASGGSAYVITFDQRYGPVADLIDSLAEKYGFRHYTRYSRLGELRPGESFEELYDRLSADLEQVLQPVLVQAVKEARSEHLQPSGPGSEEGEQRHDSWEDIEITVQQISLLHRHDFAVDGADRLASMIRGLQSVAGPGKTLQPPPEQVLRKVFKIPPSSSLIGLDSAHQRAVSGGGRPEVSPR